MKKIKEIWQKIRARLSGANLAHGPIAEMAEEGDGGKRMPVWLRKTIWAVFLTGFLTCFFVFLAFAWYAFIYLDDEFDLSSVDSSLNYTSVVYGLKDGAYVEAETLHTSENRIWANIEEIPDDLQKAFIAIEDERFYQHSGVDLLRTAKAVLNFLNISSDSVYGGSTITQQVIKNITGESEQTIPRKIQEIRRAWYVEREYKKDQILEVYLNTIYLSQGCYGVQTAAEVYFNKTLDELTLLECASIAAITNLPTYYDPIQNPENNLERAHLVINKMLELGYISQEEADAAKAAELELHVGEGSSETTSSEINSYFVDQVILDVIDALVEDKGYSEAWMHHKGRNRHHYEYWADMNRQTRTYEPIAMPRKYFVEMIMDRRAACMTYQGKAYRDDSPLIYFEESREKDLMHPETRRELSYVLTMLAEKGEKETFRYLKEEVLKGHPWPWEENT